MTQEEYLEKCASVANTLAKITKGIAVSREERLKACLDAIEIFYCDQLPKLTSKNFEKFYNGIERVNYEQRIDNKIG